MSFLTFGKKNRFRIGRRFCMVEYVKNVNIRYVRTMTFQLHSKFFTEEHVYFTDQHNEMTFVSCNMIEKPNAKTGRQVTF
jgi:hypothetical protein